MTPSDPDFGPRRPDPSDAPVDALELFADEGAAARSELKRRAGPSPWRLLGQRIATHNPLYAVSAALVCYGLQTSFPASDVSGYAPKLAICLAAYVVLLTAVAIGLRRLGTLWQDLRMVGLLVVLLLPMISVTLDETLLAAPATGIVSLLVGGLFAALIGELLLHGLRIRLPLWYRLPYHLLMSLFFVYPLLFARAAGSTVDPHDPVLQWKLFGFAQAGAAILLIGLIAILRGPEYVSQNGTPWRWPLYPTAIFAFLVLCLAGRAFYLCRSFHPIGERESIFGAYFLVPLVMVIGGLVIAAGRRTWNSLATGVGLAMVWCATLLTEIRPTSDEYYREFLDRFREVTGALPPLASLWLAAAIFGIAAVCRIRWSEYCFAAVLTHMGFVGPQAPSVLDPLGPYIGQPWTPMAGAALMLVRGWRRRDSFDIALASLCILLSIALLDEQLLGFPDAFVSFHALLVVLLSTGVLWGSERGGGLRAASAFLLVVALGAWYRPDAAPLFDRADWALRAWYPIVIVATTVAAALATRDPKFIAAVGWMLGGTAVIFGWRGYVWLKRWVAGLDAIVLGLTALAAAVAVSLAKVRRERDRAS